VRGHLRRRRHIVAKPNGEPWHIADNHLIAFADG
jgi:hypothetical protein